MANGIKLGSFEVSSFKVGSKDCKIFLGDVQLYPTGSPCAQYEYVDLGLPSKTMWAKVNVGACYETDYGNYYQYGKGADAYKTTSGQSDYSGTEERLSTTADTPSMSWGYEWCMPTQDQINELTANTTYTWETNFKGSGVNGGKFTASNGNYIFFPAAGDYHNGSQEGVSSRGCYWTSSPMGSTNVHYLMIASSASEDTKPRDYGFSVRPVLDSRLVIVHSVPSTAETVKILNNTSGFSEIEIDGVVQPSVVTGHTFSSIGEHVVKYTLANQTTVGYRDLLQCIHTKTVHVPPGVVNIEREAFSALYNVTDITLSDTVVNIGINAFYQCNDVTSFTLGNSVEVIGDGAFRICDKITSFTLPNSITRIDDNAFAQCTRLSSINIPDSVKSIGSKAFSATSMPIINNIRYADNCAVEIMDNSLTSYTLENGTRIISDGLFSGFTQLTSFTIPNSVITIGKEAFRSCTGITSIDIPSINIFDGAFRDCSGLTSITISSNATLIDKNAFRSCVKITSLTVPDSVTTIGDNALFYCSGLTSLELGSGVTTIGSGVCSGCTSLQTLTVNSNGATNGSLGGSLIGLTTSMILNIGDNVTVIGDSAFRLCSGITTVNIGTGVTSIEAHAFRSCGGLTGITIPDNVTSIGEAAFRWTRSFTTCTIGSGVTTVGFEAFRDSTLTSCTIGNSVTSIGSSAFYKCVNITTIMSYATTAPTIQNNTFQDVKTNGTLTVPIGSSGYDTWMGTGNYYLGKYGWSMSTQ